MNGRLCSGSMTGGLTFSVHIYVDEISDNSRCIQFQNAMFSCILSRDFVSARNYRHVGRQ